MSTPFKSLIAAAVLLLTATNCRKDFLDRTPPGDLTFEEFFKTPEQAVESVNAVYEQFRSFDCVGLGYLGCTDIISDDADKGSTPNDQPLLADVDNFYSTLPTVISAPSTKATTAPSRGLMSPSKTYPTSKWMKLRVTG